MISFIPSPSLLTAKSINPFNSVDSHHRSLVINSSKRINRKCDVLQAVTISGNNEGHTSKLFRNTDIFRSAAQSFSNHLPTARGLAALLLIDFAFKSIFSMAHVCFPPALAGMLGLLTTLMCFEKFNPKISASINTFFAPAVAFLSRWMAVFFIPVLIMLPLSAQPYPPARDVFKITSVILSGFILSLSSSALLSLGLGRLSQLFKQSDPVVQSQSANTKAKSTGSPSPPSAKTTFFWGFASILSSISALVSPGISLIARICMSIGTTLFCFCLSQRLPSKLKSLFHPLIVTIGSTLLFLFAFGKVSGMGLFAVLAEYLTKGQNGSTFGGGDILMKILGPAIVSFAIQIYSRRELIRNHALEVFGTTTIASIVSLFGTALLCRVFGVPDEFRLALIPRMVTAPLAICIGDILGADSALAGSIAATTGLLGASFYKLVLDKLGIDCPVSRGLSTGTSSHGIGTAAILKEQDAFAFSATAMALCGIVSTVLVSIPEIRTLLVAVALGSDAAKLPASVLRGVLAR